MSVLLCSLYGFDVIPLRIYSAANQYCVLGVAIGVERGCWYGPFKW